MKKITKQLFLYFFLFTIIKIILSYFIPADSAFSDNYYYVKLARSFFNSQEFSIHGDLYYSRQPLYPIILSISYLFKDMTYVYLAMKLINSIISSLIIFPVFLLLKEFLPQKKALISAILISLLPFNFAFASYIMSENLFYSLFLFSIYFIYKSFVENNYKYHILAGLFVALSFLTRTFGIILLFLFILLSLIQFIRKKSQLNPLIFLMIFSLIISPWIFKIISQFGFSMLNIAGSHSIEASSLSKNIFSFTFYIKIILYLGYIILATGIFFSLMSIFSFKNILKNEKYLLFNLIILFATFSMLIISANHGGDTYIFKWLGSRPMGRYIETILPLIFIAGFVGFNSYQKNKEIFEKYFKITILILIPILIFSSLLATFPLFPVNNMSLTWVGILRYIFEYIFYKKTNFDIIPSYLSLIFLAIIFLSILTLIFLLRKKITFKNTMPIFLIFFLSLSLINYSINYYNTNKYWYKGEQMQLGLWLNKYDKEDSLIIFDERDCIAAINKLNQISLCEPFGVGASISGIWLNNDIKIGTVSNPPKNSIIISRHNLNFPKIKETESGIFVYKVDSLSSKNN